MFIGTIKFTDFHLKDSVIKLGANFNLKCSKVEFPYPREKPFTMKSGYFKVVTQCKLFNYLAFRN